MTIRSPEPRLAASNLMLCLCLTQARTPEYALMAAACGFDAIYVDLEHASTSLETASMLCVAASAAGLRALVRTPSPEASLITRALDGGAQGVIVPHVNTPAEARAIIDACRFAPVGRRSPVTSNAVTRYAPLPLDQAMAEIDARTLVALMLETPQAVGAADQIAAVPGVDLLIIGAFDLTAELGIGGQFGHPKFRDAVSRVAAACRRQGLMLGLAGVSDRALMADYIEAGVRFVSVGTETGMFMEAARQRTAALRALASPATPTASSSV